MLRTLVVLPVLPAVACSSAPTCNDVTGLNADESNVRTKAAYLEKSPDPAKRCDACAHYIAAPEGSACGTCRVIKGPIAPGGTSSLFVAKT